MPVRKTEEEMALAARLKVIRSLVRLEHSLRADRELNQILADISEGHAIELQTGGLIEMEPGTLEKVVKEVSGAD